MKRINILILKPMKILLVHADKFPWATTRRAETLKKEWVNDEVDIAYFKNLPNGDKYDVIHILFSGGIGKIRDFILQHKHKTFTTMASQRTLDNFFDKKEILKEIYSSTVCCVCLNPDLNPEGNSVYIPNGVDEKLFYKPFVAGFVGYTKEHKGFPLAKKACEELGIQLNVANDIPYGKMPEFYKSIDCLIIPSESEGCNNPTLEALAMNIPVISTNVGIAGELEGVTLVDRDVTSIKKALRKLNGRLQILDKYTWKIIAKKYKQLYVEKQGVK